MDVYEQLPVLLRVKIENNNILFRLDKNGLGSFTKDKNSIHEIYLSGCILEGNLIDELKNFANEIFEYEIYKQNNKTIFQFWADYGRFESEIECKEISEAFSGYTKEDLFQKGSALYELYVDLHKRFSENEGINYQLREKLIFEISNEIERSRRKAEFFENKEKAKSETFQSEIKFLQRLQKILQ